MITLECFLKNKNKNNMLMNKLKKIKKFEKTHDVNIQKELDITEQEV